MARNAIHISLLAIPEADASALNGLFTILNLFQSVVPGPASFNAEVVAPQASLGAGGAAGSQVFTILGLPITVQRTVERVEHTDALIVPSLFTDEQGEWYTGRYPQVTAWIKAMYARDAIVCSACTGALLLAETGLLDGEEATQHWAFERTFRRNFPAVKLNPEKILVTAGPDQRLVMSGASAAWHDLLLYLIARCAGAEAARIIAKYFLLQWHTDGQLPFIIFQENTWHGDSAILAAQAWLRRHSHEARPVESVVQQSGLPERSFGRRFRKATGYKPIHYVQQLRIEAAKRQLETSSLPVDEISWRVGYQDPAFFRRLFKRLTGLTPGVYRRRFSPIEIKK